MTVNVTERMDSMTGVSERVRRIRKRVICKWPCSLVGMRTLPLKDYEHCTPKTDRQTVTGKTQGHKEPVFSRILIKLSHEDKCTCSQNDRLLISPKSLE